MVRMHVVTDKQTRDVFLKLLRSISRYVKVRGIQLH